MPHILLTRPTDASRRFADRLVGAGVAQGDITIAPVFDIVVPPLALNPDPGTLLILTSQNAVQAAAQVLAGASYRAVCVGDRTTQSAQAAGFDARCLGDTVSEFLDRFAGHPGPVLHLRGTHTTTDIAQHLAQAGQAAQSQVIYDQRETPWTDTVYDNLKGGTPVVLPLFSPRSAALVCKRLNAAVRHQIVAISPAVAQVCRDFGFDCVAVASQPNGQAVLDLTKAAYVQPSLEAGSQAP